VDGVSLVIPFYNEESVLRETLEETWTFLLGLGRSFELLLADDGSTDSSPSIAKEYVQRDSERCRLFQNSQNLGRGSILKEAFSHAQMPIIAYVDADLEIGLPFVEQLIHKFEDPVVTVVTGSKLTTPQPLIRARHRKLASFSYNFLVRTILHSSVSDHQCGLKGFRNDLVAQLLPLTQEKGWSWDTEMLLLAQKRGEKVLEFPVELHSRRKSTVPFVRTVFMYLVKILQFRFRGLAL